MIWPSLDFDPFTFTAVLAVAAWLYRTFNHRIERNEDRIEKHEASSHAETEQGFARLAKLEEKVGHIDRVVNQLVEPKFREKK